MSYGEANVEGTDPDFQAQMNTTHLPRIFSSFLKAYRLNAAIPRLVAAGVSALSREIDKDAIRRWRKRGFYSENALVKFLQKNGYCAVRVPVSNPSLNPLPDVIGRKNEDVYAFEVKNASYYAYFPAQQIDKLFRFLHQMIPLEERSKHAVVVAHLGKRWIFRELDWEDWHKSMIPDKVRILKRDRGNFSV